MLCLLRRRFTAREAVKAAVTELSSTGMPRLIIVRIGDVRYVIALTTQTMPSLAFPVR